MQAALLGESIRRVSVPDGGNRDVVFVNLGKSGCSIGFGSNPSEPVVSMPLEEHLCQLDKSAVLILKIEPDRYLKRFLSPKKLPFTRAHDMAVLDLADHMPFFREDVHLGFAFGPEGSGTNYFVIKRSVLDPVILAVRKSGCQLASIEMGEGECSDLLTSASVRSIMRSSTGWSLKSQLLAGSIGALVLMLAVTFTHAYVRGAEAATRLASEVDGKRREALEIRKRADALQQDFRRLQSARAAKVETIPASVVWEELTRIFPDSTWLTDLTIREGTVSATGFSNAAADLIAIIGASPLFDDPIFTAPVMRVPGQDGERFSIQMKVAAPS